MLQDWINAIDARGVDGRLVFRERSDVFPDLVNAWEPVGFELAPDAGHAETDGTNVWLRMKARLFAEGAVETGLIERELDTRTGTVNHVFFRVPQMNWNQGHGRRMIRRAADVYAEAGLTSITTQAAGVGKYIWGRCGFRFADEVVAANVNRVVTTFARDLRLISPTDRLYFEHPWEFAALDVDAAGVAQYVGPDVIEAALAVREGRDRRYPLVAGDMTVSKALLIFADYTLWDGVLDLVPTSPSYQRLIQYTEGYL